MCPVSPSQCPQAVPLSSGSPYNRPSRCPVAGTWAAGAGGEGSLVLWLLPSEEITPASVSSAAELGRGPGLEGCVGDSEVTSVAGQCGAGLCPGQRAGHTRILIHALPLLAWVALDRHSARSLDLLVCKVGIAALPAPRRSRGRMGCAPPPSGWHSAISQEGLPDRGLLSGLGTAHVFI